MSRNPDNFLRAEAGLASAQLDADRLYDQMLDAVTRLSAAASALGTLGNAHNASPPGYGTVGSYINARAAANPTDEAWQDLKRRRDKIVADFQAMQTRAASVAAAAIAARDA